MYGDTTAIRWLAASLRDQAAEIRSDASRLLAEAVAVPWQGVAADAMRAGASDQAAAMERTAVLHDDAAAALERHATQVDAVKARILAVEREVVRLVGAARDRLGGLLGLAADPLDVVLDRFVAPPEGHLAWLHVELPGLHVPDLHLPDLHLPDLHLPGWPSWRAAA